MVLRTTLENYLNEFLKIKSLNDYCHNGLQIEGKSQIKTIVTGVSANLALLKAAIKKKADAIIVHHGYFWKGEADQITGVKYQRIATLIKDNINLFAYHLPLDIHPQLGNNVMLAQKLACEVIGEFDTNTQPNYGLLCQSKAISLEELQQKIETNLKRKPLVVGPNKQVIQKIAICTGGAQDFIEASFNAGADVYISGEISERTTHMAHELGISYIAAGHHATERYGIKALGEHLADKFKLVHHFIDIDNPV